MPGRGRARYAAIASTSAAFQPLPSLPSLLHARRRLDDDEPRVAEEAARVAEGDGLAA